MNRKSILKRIYLPLLFLATVLAVGFRTSAMFFDFNSRIGYFDGKGLINTASIMAISGAVLLFTYAFSGSKSERLIATFTTPATYVPSIIIVTSLIFFVTKTYGRIKDFDFSSPAGGTAQDVLAHVTSNVAVYVSAALVPLGLLAAACFILNATVAERHSVSRAAFGICTVLFFALYASFLYFDTTLAINSPNKIVDQMAFVFAALFFLYEIRISLARECWHLYIAFGFIAALLCAYSSIPSLVIFFAKDVCVSHSVEENLLTLCLAFFITSRLVLASKLNPDKESEFVTVIREQAGERNRYILEKEEIERRAYIELYNRLSEIEELPEDANENELFGIESASEEAAAIEYEEAAPEAIEQITEETSPEEEVTATEEVAPAEEVAPTEEAAVAEEAAPAEEAAATEEVALAEEAAATEEVALAEEVAVAEEVVPAEEAVAEEATPAEETDLPQSANEDNPEGEQTEDTAEDSGTDVQEA